MIYKKMTHSMICLPQALKKRIRSEKDRGSYVKRYFIRRDVPMITADSQACAGCVQHAVHKRITLSPPGACNQGGVYCIRKIYFYWAAH